MLVTSLAAQLSEVIQVTQLLPNTFDITEVNVFASCSFPLC